MSDQSATSDSGEIVLRRALVRHDSDQGRRWLEFRDPVAHFVADDLSEVGPTIDAVEAAASRGLWLVGFLSYDAAPAFDEALSSLRDPAVPLAAFAAFAEPRPSRGPAGRAFDTTDWTPDTDQLSFEAAVESIRGLARRGRDLPSQPSGVVPS